MPPVSPPPSERHLSDGRHRAPFQLPPATPPRQQANATPRGRPSRRPAADILAQLRNAQPPARNVPSAPMQPALQLPRVRAPILPDIPRPADQPNAAAAHAPPQIARTGNFILPSDVDANGNLLATVTSFPRAALNIMKAPWSEHIPLQLLFPSTITSSIRKPKDSAPADSDDDDKLQISESQWRQAFPILQRLIYYHCPCPNKDAIVDGLNAHYETLTARPDFYSEFLLYMRYDMEIRKLTASNDDYIPKGWEPNIFDAIHARYLKDIARGLVSNGRLVKRLRSRSPSPRRSHRYPSSNPYPQASRPYDLNGPYRSFPSERPAPYRPPYGAENRFPPARSFQANESTFCIVCGHLGHSAFNCSTSRAPFLIQDRQSGKWLAPGGIQYCYRWNNNSGACRQCSRDHKCTLCGNRNHNARKCPKSSA